jgi:hypothetical protein
MRNKEKICYTIAHRKAFLKVEKELLHKNTVRGYLHDLDKVLLLPFMDKEKVSALHRKNSRHHAKAHTKSDYIQMIVDWECARLTKADKPLNARQTLEKYYPELQTVIEPLLYELGL